MNHDSTATIGALDAATYDHAWRVLICDHCGAPLHVPTKGGSVDAAAV